MLDSAAATLDDGANFSIQGKKPEYLRQQRVSAGFFRVLGARPRLGREFTAEEDRPGGPSVAILSDALWQRAFHADPAVIGRAVTLGGEPAVVVGVMPAGFQTDAPEDIWAPLRPSEAESYAVVARLRPGVTLAAAKAQVDTLSAQALSQQVQEGVAVRMRLLPLQRARSLTTRTPLLVLWAAAGAVLLIGCVNLAGLLLAQSKGRARELATRMALGGDRPAVVRQLLAESLLLVAGGGATGLALGWMGARGLRLLAPASFKLATTGLDLRVLMATAGLSLLSGLLFGLLPAWRASDVDLRAAMGPGGVTHVPGGLMQRWPRRLLVVGEVALCMTLLIAATLLVRSLAALSEIRPGFEAANVLTAKQSLHDARYRTSRQVARLFEAGLSRIRELPGVEAAAAGLAVPYERWLYMGFKWVDRRRHPNAQFQNLVLTYVTADYFTTLRIPVLRGRAIDGGDRADSEPVVVVSEAFAREYMHGEEAVGSRIWIGGQARRIVGVAGDVQQRQGWEDSSPLVFLSPLPAAYLSVAQTEDWLLQRAHTGLGLSPSWIVRAKAPPAAVLRGIQRAVEAADPALPLAGFHTMAEIESASLRGRRFLAILFAMFAGLALVLAAVAIYSLIANTVAERTQELGIRMALGATVRQAMTAVAVPGMLLALAGIAGGSLLARLTARVIRHLLWGVSPTDLITFTAAPLLLLGVAGAACLLPVLQVARLDPAQTLRQE